MTDQTPEAPPGMEYVEIPILGIPGAKLTAFQPTGEPPPPPADPAPTDQDEPPK